jgi:hypothetical protein
MLDPRRLPRQASRYLRGFSWLLRESLRVAATEWRRIVLATLMFLGGNAALLGAIFLYVRLLEQNQAIALPGVSLHPRESVLLLGVFIATVLVGLATIAVSQYVARTAALRMYQRYQEESTRTALRLTGRLPDACAPEIAALIGEAGLRPYYIEYPRSCGWTMRFIANAFPALMLFAVAFVLLLWLDPWVTSLVVLLGFLLVAAQYPSSLFAAHASNVVDQTRVDFSRKLQGLAARVDQSAPGTAPDAALAKDIDRFYKLPIAVRYQDAQHNRFWALELSALTMQTGGAVALAFILFTIVRGLLLDGGDWATLAVYAALLRQLLGTATDVFRAVTVFSRFSPHINAYRLLVAAVEGRRPCSPPPLPEALPFAAAHLHGGNGSPMLRRGERFYLLTRAKPGCGLALDLQAILLQADPTPATASADLPSIRFVASGFEAGADGAAAVATLCSALEQSSGILLADLRGFAQLDARAQARVTGCMRQAALGLVSPLPPEQVEPDALVLVRDVQARWYWLRAGEAGLSGADRRKILQRLRHPSGVAKGASSLFEAELD